MSYFLASLKKRLRIQFQLSFYFLLSALSLSMMHEKVYTLDDLYTQVENFSELYSLTKHLILPPTPSPAPTQFSTNVYIVGFQRFPNLWLLYTNIKVIIFQVSLSSYFFTVLRGVLNGQNKILKLSRFLCKSRESNFNLIVAWPLKPT